MRMEVGSGQAATINLAEHRVFSGSFKKLYGEGMHLVEEAAEYLDGQGRVDVDEVLLLCLLACTGVHDHHSILGSWG